MIDPSKIRQTMKFFALMTTISSYFVGCTLVGIFGGRWMDNYFDTGSLFLVTGLLLGLSAAVTGIYFTIRRFLGGDSDE
ncbi:AtpZ/AtpI family protein [Bacillus shivajii]|uniref:AtpZ/AtpI family protein n=1 Tax=Bacillus shivajii TaxID=1983719 RepID=UPI001CFAE389|nr:AtpZ/AtpI family protein [Bacillus shivajii]UCZ53025.1 AtpZ/AtpI family protein [Bacillus shivajii]